MVQIRRMIAADLPQVEAIEKENFSVPWSLESFDSFLARDDTVFLTAEEEGEILGYVGVLCVPDEGDITNVSVRKDRQGEKIGSSLVAEMVCCAAEKGSVKLFLEVRKSNAAAIRVYEKAGFRIVGVRKNYYQKPMEDALIMAREPGGKEKNEKGEE